jgi:hypothetical protein
MPFIPEVDGTGIGYLNSYIYCDITKKDLAEVSGSSFWYCPHHITFFLMYHPNHSHLSSNKEMENLFVQLVPILNFFIFCYFSFHK